ncbi:DUF1836 domain-containing protein [Planomicrobium sp. YIM 101495]|uniref:DUF1836 domain-containing protein n=1 Tax=Planomicrobium sp. YIM 101495 TaxID=2665160 RepID=UPI0018AC7180|nr:DUF1836 domain-containing protein [Planomicrobium sp. YIM 101495]
MEQKEHEFGGMEFGRQLHREDIPKIDLYIDQVLQLFDEEFAPAKRSAEDKILTKTMVNNYAKGKLFYPVSGKKYSPSHIMLIALIYQMKSALSINDIKKVLSGINHKAAGGELDVADFYDQYTRLADANNEMFKDIFAKQEAAAAAAELDAEERKVLLIASLTQMSQLYKRTAEKLVDELTGTEEG